MSVVLVLEYRAKPGCAEALLDMFRQHDPVIRREPELIDLAIHRDLDDPDVFVEVGAWTSREAHDDWADRWKATATEDLRAVLALLEASPTRRYCTPQDA